MKEKLKRIMVAVLVISFVSAFIYSTPSSEVQATEVEENDETLTEEETNEIPETEETPELEEANEISEDSNIVAPAEATSISSRAMPANIYSITEVKHINGIWQLKCLYLSPVGFTWTDNGIPLEAIYFVDLQGNKLANQVWNGKQTHFKIYQDRSYKTGKQGPYGMYTYHEYCTPGYGTWWITAFP